MSTSDDEFAWDDTLTGHVRSTPRGGPSGIDGKTLPSADEYADEPPIANQNGDPMYGEQITGKPGNLPVSLDFDATQITSILDELSADPTRRNLTEASLRDQAIAVVNTRAMARTAEREQRLAGGDPATPSDIRREMVGAADDADVLRAFGRAFSDAAKQGDVIAGELVPLLPPHRGTAPRRSVVVGDGHGFDLKVSNTPKTQAFANLDVIVDVLAASLADEATGGWTEDQLICRARGVRMGMAALLGVISSPTVKTTALDSLVKRLDESGEEDLAKRLGAAYGRKEVGDPTIKVERTAQKVAK